MRKPAGMPRVAPSGLPVVGEVSQGEHLCGMHLSRFDLIDNLTSFIRVGLEHGDACLLLHGGPSREGSVRLALRRKVPDLEGLEARDRIEIVAYRPGVVDEWRARPRPDAPSLRIAAAGRHDAERELELERAAREAEALVFCAYPQDSDAAGALIEHRLALVGQEGFWRVLGDARSHALVAILSRCALQLDAGRLMDEATSSLSSFLGLSSCAVHEVSDAGVVTVRALSSAPGAEVPASAYFPAGEHAYLALALPRPLSGDDEDLARAVAAILGAALERERTASQAEEALREANRRKDEFLAVLGHELRNPLAPIVTALHLMKLRGDEKTTREREVIERQVLHVSRLVDDLLDVSRITRGKLELKPEPVSLATVVASALEMTSPLFEQRMHRLEVELPDEGVLVEVDRVRFAQAIANLLTNAAKYTEPGGRVRVASKSDGERVTVSVRDTGIGFVAEALPQLFEPFVQGQRTLERAQGGLGLGLALVRSLVELHGGQVSAFSEGPGCGSEFTIVVPATRAQAARDAVQVPIDAPLRVHPSCARRVLVVDDNPDAADGLAEVLRAMGHDVTVAYDGPQALERAGAFAFEVAILDIGLPVMDGWELARRLRASGHDDACYLAVTGYGTDEDRRRSNEAGFEAHFTKPVSYEELLDRVVGWRPGVLPEQQPPEREHRQM